MIDPNWENSPWANIPGQDLPERWEKPVLVVLPVAPTDVNATLGPWLAKHVTVKRNMVRFLLPKAGAKNLYDDADLRRIARCAYLSKSWKDSEAVYNDIFRRFDKDLRRELAERFDRYAILQRWNFQQPVLCTFHVEPFVGGRAHLQRLQAWAEGVLRFWAGRDVGWDGLRADGLKAAEQVLHGRIDVRPLISTQLHAEEAIRIQLTQQQSRILRGIGARKRAAICGGAGTGKTLLALEKARQLAETTGETLLLCYNHLLADYLKTAYQGVARLHAMNYHQLCSWRVAEARRLTGRDLLRDARAAYPPSRPQDEFDLVLPHALALSCEATPLRFDAIVIDEGQDFKEEYWLPIEWLMRDPDLSYLYVFYDQNQALYTRARSLPISDPPFVLTFNCRNTRYIHESAYRFFRGEQTDAPTGNEGSPIASLPAPSVKAQAAAIHAAIVALIDRESVDASQIAVVVCGEPKETYYQAVERMPLPRGSRWVVEGAAADKGDRARTNGESAGPTPPRSTIPR